VVTVSIPAVLEILVIVDVGAYPSNPDHLIEYILSPVNIGVGVPSTELILCNTNPGRVDALGLYDLRVKTGVPPATGAPLSVTINELLPCPGAPPILILDPDNLMLGPTKSSCEEADTVIPLVFGVTLPLPTPNTL
jgi:hypothetical protein